jgi:hypothetical protein
MYTEHAKHTKGTSIQSLHKTQAYKACIKNKYGKYAEDTGMQSMQKILTCDAHNNYSYAKYV